MLSSVQIQIPFILRDLTPRGLPMLPGRGRSYACLPQPPPGSWSSWRFLTCVLNAESEGQADVKAALSVLSQSLSQVPSAHYRAQPGYRDVSFTTAHLTPHEGSVCAEMERGGWGTGSCVWVVQPQQLRAHAKVHKPQVRLPFSSTHQSHLA